MASRIQTKWGRPKMHFNGGSLARSDKTRQHTILVEPGRIASSGLTCSMTTGLAAATQIVCRAKVALTRAIVVKSLLSNRLSISFSGKMLVKFLSGFVFNPYTYCALLKQYVGGPFISNF
jgi:hypothetical protein